MGKPPVAHGLLAKNTPNYLRLQNPVPHPLQPLSREGSDLSIPKMSIPAPASTGLPEFGWAWAIWARLLDARSIQRKKFLKHLETMFVDMSNHRRSRCYIGNCGATGFLNTVNHFEPQVKASTFERACVLMFCFFMREMISLHVSILCQQVADWRNRNTNPTA